MPNSVEKSLSVLSALADGKNLPVTVSDLAKAVGINRSTCSHIVKTLVENGYAQRVSHKEGYVLGPEAYRLSRFGQYENATVEICRPVMKWLHKKTGQAIVLSVIQNEEKYIITLIDKERKIFKEDETIRIDDIYRTATGRVLLANMEEEDVKKIYGKYGAPKKKEWEGVDTYEKLLSALGKIGKRDIVTTVEKMEWGYRVGIGGAVFAGYKCMGAIGVAFAFSDDEYPSFEMKRSETEKMLRKGIAEINRRMSYR